MTNHPPHHDHPEGTAVAEGVGADFERHEALRRLDCGFACTDDFLLLSSDPEGMDTLRERNGIVWPQLRCLAVLHPELIPPFVEWFRDPERMEPYLDAAFEAVADEDHARWTKYWAVVVQSQEPGVAAELFLGLLRSRKRDLATLSRPGRSILRREARQILTTAGPELVPLLFPSDLIECREILEDPNLPAEWRGFALAATLKSSKSRVIRRDVYLAALAYLPKAPPDVLHEYILRAQHILADHPELWTALAESGIDRGTVIDHLLELGTAVADARWRPLLDAIHAFAPNGPLDRDRLARVLTAVGLEPDGWPVWDAAIARLDTRFLTGDFSQSAEWLAIEKVRQRATRSRKRRIGAFPDAVAAKLEAGITIQRWMTRTEAGASARQLQASFAALGCPLPESLHTIFHKAFGSPTVGEDLPKVERFAQMFLALYPVDANAEDAAIVWQSIAAGVPSPHRETLLGYFWARMVPTAEPDAANWARPAKAVEPSAPHVPWILEALLYSGIIAGVVLLFVALLLFW